MAIEEGDYVMSFISRDGKPIAQRVSPANSQDQYAIPGLTRDGKTAAMSVTPASSEGEIVISAITRDGLTAALKSLQATTVFVCSKLFPERNSTGVQEFGEVLILLKWANGDFCPSRQVENYRGLEHLFIDDLGAGGGTYTVRTTIKLSSGDGTLYVNFGTPAPIDPIDGLQTITNVSSLSANAIQVKYYYDIGGDSEEDISLTFKSTLLKNGSDLVEMGENDFPFTVVKVASQIDKPTTPPNIGDMNVGGKFFEENAAIPELQLNGDFSSWTGDDPDNWTVVGEDSGDPEVSEVGTTEGHGGSGTGACNFFSTTGDPVAINQVIALTTLKRHNITFSSRKGISGKLRVYDADNLQFDETYDVLGVDFRYRRFSILFQPTQSSINLTFELIGSGDYTIFDVIASDVETKKDALIDGYNNSPSYAGVPPVANNVLVDNAAPTNYGMGTRQVGTLSTRVFLTSITSKDTYIVNDILIPAAVPEENLDTVICPYNSDASSDNNDAGREIRFKTIVFSDPITTISKSDFHFSAIINRQAGIPQGQSVNYIINFMKKITPSDWTSLSTIPLSGGETGYSIVSIKPEIAGVVVGDPIQFLRDVVYGRSYNMSTSTSNTDLYNIFTEKI